MKHSHLAVLAAVVLTGCGRTPLASVPAVATPTPKPQTPEATQLPSTTVTPSPTGSPVPFVGDTAAPDELGDPRHENGKADDDPGYIDIVRVDASADGVTLRVGMTLRTKPPTTRSNSVERLRYYFALDTTGDGVIDYLLNLENHSDTKYHAAVDDWTGLAPAVPTAFEMTINGRRIEASLALSDLRSPTSLQFCAFSMSAVPGGDAIFVKDYSPDGFCEGSGEEPDRHMAPLT